MRKNTVKKIAIGSLISLLSFSVSMVTFAWFVGSAANTKDRTADGLIGLRSYFYAGDGSGSDPYEIVSPIHFYNLTRLQNLGIFSGKTYFRIGHIFEGDTTPSCVMEYDQQNNPIKRPYLDMKSLCYGANAMKLLPIGNEATPFFGEFDGQGIPIRNLKITGYPEDIGVFGYVDYQGVVNGLVLDGTIDNGLDGIADTADDNVGVEICSMGYGSQTDNKNDYKLFSADIDNIFTSAHYFKDAKLSISRYQYQAASSSWKWSTPVSLKAANGNEGGTTLDSINGYTQYATESTSSNKTGDVYNKAYFKIDFPEAAADRPFEYTWVSSSDLLRAEKVFDIDGDGNLDEAIVVDMTTLKNSPDFNNGTDMQTDARISIVATTEVDGYKFSRVIQSYVFEFRSNGDIYDGQGSTGSFSTNIFCDYAYSPAGAPADDYKTNYHHGNNIGYLVGHLNGSLTNSYVYNAKLTFNQTGLTPVLTESDTGLVGEIGKNVVNSIDPELGITTNGNIGVMNFTKIYSMIRNDMDADRTHTLACGRAQPFDSSTNVDFISYDDFKASTFSDYEQYMRHDYPGAGLSHHYIIQTSKVDMTGMETYTIDEESDIKSDFNKVDFIWNKVIEGEELGLGVFKIITGRYDLPQDYQESDYGRYMLNGIGESQIVNGTPKDLVYFSTAEYDHTVSNHHSWNDRAPLRGVHLPVEYSKDINSFSYPFSRDYNYCFQLDLKDMALAGQNNYMYNTQSDFLKAYLGTKVIDGYGRPVKWMNPSFGFMFARRKDNVIERLTSLSSYMPVGTPDFSQKYDPMGTGKYYPPKCIAFSIENDFGGNVSVVGNGGDISIYRVDTSTASKNDNKDKIMYSMRSTNVAYGDQHRYFEYDVATGATEETVNINSGMDNDNRALYGHIFKLPKGDYVIGARTGTANVYFLAVQGQEKGEIGDTTYADIGFKVENVDFLNVQPTYSNFIIYDPSSDDPTKKTALKVAGVSFSANFNDRTAKTFYVKSKIYNGSPVFWIDFEDGATPFVTYLITYSENSSLHYIQDGAAPYSQTSVAYRSS